MKNKGSMDGSQTIKLYMVRSNVDDNILIEGGSQNGAGSEGIDS